MMLRWGHKHTFLYLFICLAIVCLRLYGVDLRPLHHDESLHGAYSLYYFQDPLTGFYKYDPLLHGPFLYHIIPWFYWFFGLTKYALRLPAVLFSSSLLFIPLLFKKRLGTLLTFMALFLLGTSPTLTYWSRFLRHDNFVHFSFLLITLAIVCKNSLTRATLLSLGLAIHLCSKENFYIHTVFLIAFLSYEALHLKYDRKNTMPSLVTTIFSWIKKYKLSFLWGCSLFLFITFYFYSAGFHYSRGIWNLLSGKAFSYWATQHQSERISGPFSFPFLINSFFESWWFLLFFVQSGHFFIKRKRLVPYLLGSLLISFLFYLNTHFEYIPGLIKFTSQYLKIKTSYDNFLFFPLITYGILGTSALLLEKRRELALLHFFFTASLFTYSFVGEKVPWLASYPLLCAIFYYIIYFRSYTPKLLAPILSLVILLNIPLLIWSNWTHHSSPRNLLTQVHTSEKFENTLFFIQEEMENNQKKLLAKFETTWPTTWYLHGFPQYSYGDHQKITSNYSFILTTTHDKENKSFSQLGYSKRVIPFRSWWLPNYKELTPKSFFNYLFLKEIYGEVGHHNIAVWEKAIGQEESSRK